MKRIERIHRGRTLVLRTDGREGVLSRHKDGHLVGAKHITSITQLNTLIHRMESNHV